MADKKTNQAPPSQDSVDQIRDILFGQHLREFQQRFASLESQMKDKIDQLGNTIEQLNAHLEERLEKLDHTLRNDQHNTANELAAEIQQLEKKLSRKITETEADLCQQIDTRIHQLDDSKTSRNELAGLLRQLAAKLDD